MNRYLLVMIVAVVICGAVLLQAQREGTFTPVRSATEQYPATVFRERQVWIPVMVGDVLAGYFQYTCYLQYEKGTYERSGSCGAPVGSQVLLKVTNTLYADGHTNLSYKVVWKP